MYYITRIIEELPSSLFNFTGFYKSQTSKDDANYKTIAFWAATGVALATLCTRLCLAWKKREVKPITLQDCVNDHQNLFALQQAVNGTCKVYLGKDFVVKECGDKRSSRMIRTMLANKVIKNNKYAHLVIPKLMGEFGQTYVAEERLPICQSQKIVSPIYDANRDAFTPAVKEFTNLLMRCKFTDVVVYNYFVSRIVTPVPRYDNVCPYLEKGEGKLGLVDLEHFEENAFWFSAEDENFGVEIKYCNIDICERLIHLFPLHFDEILEVMQSAGLKLSADDLQQLRSAQNDQLVQRRTGVVVLATS